MHELSQKKVLIIDCQTTGMHPSNGFLLQLGWSIINPQKIHPLKIEKWTLKIPEHEQIPAKIRRLLQITDEELSQSIEPSSVFGKLQSTLKKLGPEPIVIAHYAQFESSFLKQFYKEHLGTDQFNFELFCSQKIAKRLFPNLPSHNLKAMAGFFKMPNTPKNEVSSHVAMTATVWSELIPVLISQNIFSYSSLSGWLSTKSKAIKPYQFEYNIERLMRLEITTKPGVYRMLAKDKSILYVGKATSLKSRVNSYFRGVKNRDRRKLEMLAQVWDIETIECETPLEAALLESDEIKKWNPPYNVLLKAGNRKIIFYNYEFTQFSENKDATFFNGPFKPYDELMILLELIEAIETKKLLTYSEEGMTADVMSAAWNIFRSTYELESLKIDRTNLRNILFIAYKMLQGFEKIHGKGGFQKWWVHEKKKNLEDELSLEQKFANKIARIFIRAAETKRKSRQLNLLYNSSIMIYSTQKKITLINGEFEDHLNSRPIKNNGFNLHHYDRLSLLLSAKIKKVIVSE
ncbi:excinuclease ABC subunit C [Legionella wadsworthii]|uniref:Excinuclease ABC subunit C n=1 Tax=Legionella wadsworthii TaxID=28088 RepID=A0A378LPK7_9GAMM|nr:GIY-YIG nuclease family protein [Legionella wadsworthii]STY28617.1 excinuclease ABC subunit C [Legionella wadsworthii]